MAKLYRIVPDAISTTLTTGYLSDVNEDLFYKLGYINVPSGGYFGIYESGKGMVWEKNSNSMFFFTSPWSCVRGIKFLRDYGDKEAKILEYEVPDEIVNSSKSVFTNYSNWQAMGKMIPLELLLQSNSLCKSLNDELKEKLEQVAVEDVSVSTSVLCQTYSKYDLDSINNFLASRISRINNRRFAGNVSYFKSDMITGRSMVVTGTDCDVMFDVMTKKSSEEGLCEMMRRSNGILTPENFVEYDFDVPVHQYGPILT